MKILIVDDDPKLRGFLKLGLEEHDYECLEAASVSDALLALEGAQPPDLILLDVMLPDGEGWQVLLELRSTDKVTPVIFLTARSQVDERVRGLEMGADDYIIKPFEFRELLARIHVAMRRTPSRTTLTWGSLILDNMSNRVEHAGKWLELSPKEFALLRTLMTNSGEVVNRSQLLSDVWGFSFDPGTNVVEVGVARLRKRLSSSGPERIETVTGKGYRMATAEGTAG
ncbi:MAG: response regulator transcription factor [Planctomycetota bacterium]|nr:response regulator transcription factor [Planctomycetota bacterium]